MGIGTWLGPPPRDIESVETVPDGKSLSYDRIGNWVAIDLSEVEQDPVATILKLNLAPVVEK